MFEFIPMTREHVLSLMPDFSWDLDQLVKAPYSRTGIYNGKIMVCGGVVELWANRAYAWTIFNEGTKAEFVPTFRAIRRFLKEQPFKRVEMAIPVGLVNAQRRAKMLGFKLECPYAESFLPGGQDCALYALVRR